MKSRFVHFARDVKHERGRFVRVQIRVSVPVAPEDLLGEQDDLARRLDFALLLRTLRQLDRNRRQAVKWAALRFHPWRPVRHFESVENLLLRRLDPPVFDLLFFEGTQRPLALARRALRITKLRWPKLATAAHLFRLHS